MFVFPKEEEFNRKEFFFLQNIQYFCLPKPIINHILFKSQISPQLLMKLYQTCKYFWSKLKIVPCDRFTLCGYIFTIGYGREFCHPKLFANFKFCISGYLVLYASASAHEQCFETFFSTNLLYEVKTLTLQNVKMTSEEYQKVTSKVKDLELIHVTATDSNGSVVPVGKLMKYIPNISKFYYSPKYSAEYASDVSQKFAELPAFEKLKYLTLKQIDEKFNKYGFKDFLQNLKHDFELNICFKDGMSSELKWDFRGFIETFMKSFENFKSAYYIF